MEKTNNTTVSVTKFTVMYNNEFMCASFDNECDAQWYIAEMPDADSNMYTIVIEKF